MKYLGRYTAAVVALMGIVYACGSPEITFAPPPPADGGDEAASAADGAPSTPDGGGTIDAPFIQEAAPGDDAEVVTRQDAAKIEAGGSCVGIDPCDCDNDGYRAIRDDCPGGNDCADFDALRHPNVSYVPEPPDQGKNGDWDCNGHEEKQYEPPLDCAALLSCNKSARGFLTDVDCGVVARYYGCAPGALGLGCSAVDAGTRQQGCK